MSQWDQLTDIFGCTWNDDTIPAAAADNICMAWPSILACIDKAFPNPARLHALDFGCGGGLFCRRLFDLGFEVTGYDESDELIKIARANTPPEVTITNSSTTVARQGKYDVITAIMVFQFIDDIESTLRNLVSLLTPSGLILYAVFNPDFINENAGTRFSRPTNSRTWHLALKDGIQIPFFLRTASEYRHSFASMDFKEVYVDFPAFTDEFLKKYQVPFSTKHSEFLIQAFRRVA